VVELIEDMGEEGIAVARETTVCEEDIIGREGCSVFVADSGNCAVGHRRRQRWKEEVANDSSGRIGISCLSSV